MINNFTLLFLSALSLTLCLKLWLATRQINHVRKHRDAVPPQFADRINLAAHQKAADYTLAKIRFGFLGLVVENLLLLALTFGGGLAVIYGFWDAQFSNALFVGVALIFSVGAISMLIDLPFTLYTQFVIEEKYGFNRMTVKLFCVDSLKEMALGLLIGTPVLFIVLWLMGAMGAFWWLYVWAFWCGFNLLMLFIFPTWIAPLFNKFTPLEDVSLKERIDALALRCGFTISGLFVMDGSKRSGHGNAYFTGFGKTKRIVFFDTLLNRLSPAQIEAVLAHELGHFKHRHVIKRIVLMFALSFALLALLGSVMQEIWFYEGLGVNAGVNAGVSLSLSAQTSPNTALALILFFLVLPVFSFLFTPFLSALSRRHEFEADRYAASQASADDLICALVKLYEDNAATLTPDPLHSLFYDSHPPALLRIARLS